MCFPLSRIIEPIAQTNLLLIELAQLFICAKGTSQAGMLVFQFGAAREREKLAKRVSHRCPIIFIHPAV